MATIDGIKAEIGDRVSIPTGNRKQYVVTVINITGSEIWFHPPIPDMPNAKLYEYHPEPRVGELLLGKNGAGSYHEVVQAVPISFKGFKEVVEIRNIRLTPPK